MNSFFYYCADKSHTKQLQEEVHECNSKISQLSMKLERQDDDISYLKEELKKLLTELTMTRIILKDVVDKL